MKRTALVLGLTLSLSSLGAFAGEPAAKPAAEKADKKAKAPKAPKAPKAKKAAPAGEQAGEK